MAAAAAKTIGVVLLVGVLTHAAGAAASVYVHGYFRSNGTYVQPHYRSNPDGNPFNNYSFPGNYNPYTGKTATGNPSTYLFNYYNRGSSSGSGSGYGSLTLPSWGDLSSSASTPTTAGSDVYFTDAQVPAAVADQFDFVYGRQPTDAESSYWKARARSDKTNRAALADTMRFWLERGWSGPTTAVDPQTGRLVESTASGQGIIQNAAVPAIVAQEFGDVFGRQPTPDESTYWKGRARSDKQTSGVLRGAMFFQKARGRTLPL